jgi:hypothetical protein
MSRKVKTISPTFGSSVEVADKQALSRKVKKNLEDIKKLVLENLDKVVVVKNGK